MQTARHIARKGSFAPAQVGDRIVLDFDQRYRRRIVLAADSGRSILLDLLEATHVRDGDALVLADGTLVLVAARAEPLLEISAPDSDILTRIAWQLGNRHLPLQIVGTRLRIRADRVIANLLRGFGGTVVAISAPFDPESGISGSDTHIHGVERAFPHA